MTSVKLERYIEAGVSNFASESMIVLKQLLGEGSETNAEADVDFINRVRNFFNNSDNIWKKKKGKYVDDSLQARLKRLQDIRAISINTSMSRDKVESLITRIMNAVPRALNRKPTLLQDAVTYAHKGYTGQDETTGAVEDDWRPEKENAEGQPLDEQITYEDIEGALDDSRIYEEA